MVDFNNDSTISRPPKDVVSLIIIEKLYNFLEADEFYTKQKMMNVRAIPEVPLSRLRNLFLMIEPMLKRRLTTKDYTDLSSLFINKIEDRSKFEYGDIIKAYLVMSAFLDDAELTKLDTKPKFDRKKIEGSNKAQGY